MLDLLPLMLLAQERAADESLTARPMEVVQVTGSRTEQSTFDTAGAIGVVDGEAMAVRAPRIAVDGLRGVPGVFVQQTTPGQGIPIVRGLKGSEVLHLVDGVRLNNSFFRNAPNQYIALVDPALIDRIEVLRGPASTLYGADALGGVVQFLTRAPRVNESEFRISGGYGSADGGLGGGVFANWGGETGALSATLSYLDVDDRETGGATVPNTGYRSEAASLAGLVALGEHELRMDLQHLEQPSTPRVDALVPGFGEEFPESAEFFFEPNSRTFAHAGLSGPIALTIADGYEFHLSWQQLVDDRRTRDRTSVERRVENNDSRQWGITGQASVEWDSNAQLVYGFEYYRDEVRSQRLGLNIEDGSIRTLTSRFPDRSTQTSWAAYARNEWSFRSGSVVAGLRYSDFDITIPQADRDAGAQLNLDELTFTLAGTYHINDHTNLVVNYGQGFRAPNIFDLSTLGARPGNRFNIANPDLDPEHLDSIDLGVKWYGARTDLEAFVYYADFTDKITSVPTGGLTDQGQDIVRSENVGRVELRGFEGGVRHRATDDFELTLSVNYVFGEETSDGADQPADRVPPGNLALGVHWDQSPQLRVSTELRAARRQDRLSNRDVRDSRINPDGTPGWTVLDLWAEYRPDEAWRLVLGIDNAFDRAYREHGSGVDALGRNYRLSFDYTWF